MVGILALLAASPDPATGRDRSESILTGAINQFLTCIIYFCNIGIFDPIRFIIRGAGSIRGPALFASAGPK